MYTGGQKRDSNSVGSHRRIEVIVLDSVQSVVSYRLSANFDVRVISNWFLLPLFIFTVPWLHPQQNTRVYEIANEKIRPTK